MTAGAGFFIGTTTQGSDVTRSNGQDVVRLSVGNRIALAGMIGSVILAIVTATWVIKSELSDTREAVSGLRAEVKAFHAWFGGIERRIERIEERTTYGLRSSK